MERKSFFGPVEYCLLDLLRPGEMLPWKFSKPEVECGSHVAEKALETIFALLFEQLTGANALCIVTGRQMCSEPDVVAVDALGRIHACELKQRTIGLADIEQAEHYMLQFAFADPAKYLHGGWEEERRQRLAYIPCAVAGVLANENPGTVGIDRYRKLAETDVELSSTVRGYFGREPSARAWRLRKNQAEDWRPTLAVLSSTIRKTSGASFSPEALIKCGEEWARRPLFAPVPDFAQLPTPARRLVLWAIGQRIDDAAIERIRQLRMRGVDARAMEIQVKPVSGGTFRLKVRREANPWRDDLERRLQAHISGEASTAQWVADFYRAVRPSERRQRADDGTARSIPKAWVQGRDRKYVVLSRIHGDRARQTRLLLGLSENEMSDLLAGVVPALSSLPFLALCQASPRISLRVAPGECSQWGRSGIDLIQGGKSVWRPAVFVGVLVHCPPSQFSNSVRPFDSPFTGKVRHEPAPVLFESPAFI